ncbi:hypothetical protein ZIOFF_068724 [Zingiber officinale]|uniref:Uncharacterized protein n=1 Tax=Zingiber officinale TaxID=94328 RepID=A0A8J5EV43_ZINOF|nr:hypothetical protein ZIOFF_068724 [Zingiber officinale]
MRHGPGQTGLSPSPAPHSKGLGPDPSLRTLLQTTTRTDSTAKFSSWADPGSLAVTRGILSENGGDVVPSRRPTPSCPDCRLLPLLTVCRGLQGPIFRSAPTNRRGMEEQRRRCHDTQAGVPSATRPRAQLAFKDSMVHEILQFTPSIAFHYVLHRCKSRDIHCRESFD